MKIGITGATGFLGRYLIRELIDHQHEIVAWSRDPSRAESHDAIHWIKGRLGEAEAANQLAKHCDAIVHAAVQQAGPGFIGGEGEPIAYLSNNVIGSGQLLDAASCHGVNRFVFVSSGAVHDRMAPKRPLDETHPLWPGSLYGAAKASVETLVHAYGFSGKLNCCTVRPTGIYGAADPIEKSKWCDLVQKVVRGDPVHPTGGSKVVHAADVAKAIAILLHTQETVAGETYNCCDRMISHHEVAMIAQSISGSESIIEGAPKEAKHPMDTSKIQALGMQFGGTELLHSTIRQISGITDPSTVGR